VQVIAAAIAAAAKRHAEHEEEVAVLSEKLRQVLDENAGLHALTDNQAADLSLLSQEMIKLMPSKGTMPPLEYSVEYLS
jgi:predicted methyltransferase